MANDLTGTAALVQQVVDAAARLGADCVRIGMKATNLYWWHLHQALAEHPALANLQPQIAILNAKVIHGFKQIYPDLAKTDNLDAGVIADCLPSGRVRYAPPPDFRFAALQRLTRFRFHQAGCLTREKNRALHLVFLYFSNYSQYCPFAHVLGKASQAVFTESTPDEITEAPLEQLAEFTARARESTAS
ncbi:MAG: transposase [Bacillota bacterium]